MQPWLYIVILGVGIIGYAFMRPKDVEAKRTSEINDIETALDQFAEELEEGNKELMISVSGIKRDLEAEINKLNGRLSVLEQHNSLSNQIQAPRIEISDFTVDQTLEMSKRNLISQNLDHVNEVQITIPDVKNSENDIKNRYRAIFELHDQGKSIEYIAKKNGMNKGEIQLIIQLARQEEQFRA